MTDFNLSLKDTNVLKGIGLLLLLCHHLFYVQKGLYDDIHLAGDHYLVQEIGIWCKLCVAIFVFLSGYGLTIGTTKTQGIKDVKRFYWHRFTKLLMNYWFIWLIFVPISVFIFGRTFSDAYESHLIPKFFLDFIGIINCFGWYGYNATWWFYSCIIVLYIAFPFLYKLMEKNLWLLIALAVAIFFLPIHQTAGIRIYFPTFIMGMVYCRYNRSLNITPPIWLFLLFAVLAVERIIAKDTILFDALLATILIISYKSISLPNIISKPLEFCGKHSMNIFLFHTFIYYYWFQDFIYSSRNPIIIYVLLLAICLVISFVLEYIKKIIRFDKLVNYIDSLYVIKQ